MESDVRSVIEKIKASTAELTALKITKSTTPVYLATLDEQIQRAEAKLQTAEVTLLSLVRTFTRRGGQ